jgi:hypothetical protein
MTVLCPDGVCGLESVCEAAGHAWDGARPREGQQVTGLRAWPGPVASRRDQSRRHTVRERLAGALGFDDRCRPPKGLCRVVGEVGQQVGCSWVFRDDSIVFSER